MNKNSEYFEIVLDFITEIKPEDMQCPVTLEEYTSSNPPYVSDTCQHRFSLSVFERLSILSLKKVSQDEYEGREANQDQVEQDNDEENTEDEEDEEDFEQMFIQMQEQHQEQEQEENMMEVENQNVREGEEGGVGARQAEVQENFVQRTQREKAVLPNTLTYQRCPLCSTRIFCAFQDVMYLRWIQLKRCLDNSSKPPEPLEFASINWSTKFPHLFSSTGGVVSIIDMFDK